MRVLVVRVVVVVLKVELVEVVATMVAVAVAAAVVVVVVEVVTVAEKVDVGVMVMVVLATTAVVVVETDGVMDILFPVEAREQEVLASTTDVLVQLLVVGLMELLVARLAVGQAEWVVFLLVGLVVDDLVVWLAVTPPKGIPGRALLRVLPNRIGPKPATHMPTMMMRYMA